MTPTKGNASVTEIKPSVSKYLVPQERHEVHVGFRISDRLTRLVEIMMRDAKERLPWKTTTDFYRWAVHSGLQSISQDLKEGRFTNMFHHVNAHMEILRKSVFRRSALEILDTTREEVREMDRLGGSDEVPRFLRDVESNLKQMENNFWTQKTKAQFYREFGDRLKEGRVSLRPSKAVEADEED